VNDTQRKIVDAVVRKAQRDCPGSVGLIGVYGSAATGDTHEKSDLDLMILIGDENGRRVCEGFILDDIDVGFDLYCTTWDMLEGDAQCGQAHLSKLLDARIVYVADASAQERLSLLQKQARERLCSSERFGKAQAALNEAKTAFADCCLAQNLADVRMLGGAVIYSLLDALMLWHGEYFRMGVKRTFEETARLELPFDLEKMTLSVICAKQQHDIKAALADLLRAVQAHFAHPAEKAAPCAENLRGTYEEMYSNWRGKMYESANRGDVFSSFMNLVSLRWMLMDIEEGVAIEKIEFMDRFDPDNLPGNALVFEQALAQYRTEYEKAGAKICRYANADAFCRAYLNAQADEE